MPILINFNRGQRMMHIYRFVSLVSYIRQIAQQGKSCHTCTMIGFVCCFLHTNSYTHTLIWQ